MLLSLAGPDGPQRALLASSRAVPHDTQWKQTPAALLSLLEREGLLPPSCRPFELLRLQRPWAHMTLRLVVDRRLLRSPDAQTATMWRAVMQILPAGP